MNVSEMMSRDIVSVTPDESAVTAARLMFRHNIGAVPVCTEDGKLRGIVTDRDIAIRCVAAENDPEGTPVRDIMSKNMVYVSPEDSIKNASHRMACEQIRRLPVVSGGKLVGMLSLGDMAKCKAFDMEAATALCEISKNVRKA